MSQNVGSKMGLSGCLGSGLLTTFCAYFLAVNVIRNLLKQVLTLINA